MVSLLPVSRTDPAQDSLFRGWAAVFEASARAAFGDEHDAWTADQLRELGRAADQRRVDLAAVEGDRVVGAVSVGLPLLDNLSLADLTLAVRPERRGSGIGSLLLRAAEEAARAEGRTVLLAETVWPADARDEFGEGFAARHGYAAAQTVLRSSLSLPADRALLGELLDRHGTDGYATRTFVGGIPKDWFAARAELSRRMSTDVPVGDLHLEEEVWDEARVRAEYDRAVAMGRTSVDTFAVHEATGDVVGYTQVRVTDETPRVAYQQDTLVVREHRGHRLGLRLKAANTLAVMAHNAQTRVVRTWNADDNAPMLAVNRALGYHQDGHLREWQKVEPAGR